ncbi:aldo/keto reductase [Salinirubellus sp. GCM10025818]|uniref:aldo/keto reductase n=1 Tax=Salinirubellus TaxID=2162630 RepID=UPI0030CCCFB8
MEYTTLGGTGMSVSEIGLGCNTLGLDSSERWDWTVDEARSRAIVDRAIDLGINFFDTANSYSWGDSERVLGYALGEYDRDELVVATKVYNDASADPHPNSSGLSRKTIEQELANSLDRLDMDHVDLYQIHRWDDDTPIEVTVRALTDAVRRGDATYVGASSMWAYQFASALDAGRAPGLEPFATMQNHYNLVYREEEREMLPLCLDDDVGVIPWAPLAGGFLARPHEEIHSTTRGETSSSLRRRPYRENGGIEINERVEELAGEKGVSMAQIAIAWLLHKEWVDVPIVGATRIEHLEDIVEATEISLSEGDLAYLEEPYEPVRISGHE